MNLHRVINISFPRSGHHMTYEVLSRYFGDRLKYCEFYRDFEKRPDRCWETNFTKFHDHYLTATIDNSGSTKYLVTVRHPLFAIASWRIHLKGLNETIFEDSDNAIAKKKLEYWTGFINKWVLSDVPNRLIVQYESMISNSLPTFEAIVRFMCDEEPDLIALRDSISQANVRQGIPNTTKEWIGWI